MAPARTAEPSSVQELSEQAARFDYDPTVPLRYWLRSAEMLSKEAEIYDKEGNDQQTFVLLFRHAILVLEKLPKHPEAKDPKYKAAIKEQHNVVTKDLSKLEVLKPRISKQHEKYVQAKMRRDAERQKLAAQRPSLDQEQLARDMENWSLHSRKESDVSFGVKQALDAGEHRDLAAKLAHREIRRRDLAKRKVRQAGVSEEEEQRRRRGGSWNSWEEDLVGNDSKEDADDLNRSIIETGRRAQESSSIREASIGSLGARTAHPSPYNYPHVPQKSVYEVWDDPSAVSPTSTAPPLPAKGFPEPFEARFDAMPPAIPRKEFEDPFRAVPPPVPGKILDSDWSNTPSRSASATPPPQHALGPSNVSPSSVTFESKACLESGKPLRTVFLPPNLRNDFLRAAASNTQNNLETCGILCGTLISNALFISRLVIPDQKSTSDTCETTDEAALFDYCDSEDLMMLGWIHTHPTQTCFMSSRDLHTHSGYQVMMPEAIAIVCAPSKAPSWGVFRLTDPPGLKSILNCTQTGLFHPHAESHLYTDAKRPGHVLELPGLEYSVVDLRSGRA